MRVKFKKGKQRDFIISVLKNSNCSSLRSLISRGFEIQYSTLKSYFNENRTLPEDLFNQLCIFSEINKTDLEFELLTENWGKIKGGRN